MKRLALLTLAFLAFGLAQGPSDPAAPVKALVQAVRSGSDLKALTYFADESQARFLLGAAFDKATEAQRREFTQLFQTLFAKIGFPQMRENLKNLSSITYEPAEIQGDAAKVGSTVFIDRPLKKQEIKLKYSLVKEKRGWKVMDMAVLGDSLLTGIRDDQTSPVLREKGLEGLLQAMRDKNAELKNVVLR